jgi:transcription antitermination factor NusG
MPLAYQLIMVAPNTEASVSRTLAALNFEHWIFRIKRKIVLRGQVIERLVPAFPGYIFVLARNAWITIKSIIGVRSFVSFGEQLCDVPVRVVEDLCAQCDQDGVLRWAQEPTSPFALDELISVTLAQGILLQGRFQYLLTPDRAMVLVDWMGRMVCVSVRVSECKAVASQAQPSRRRHRPRYRK